MFDFEHLFSSFHKRSVRDSAYITSFLAKPLSRCSIVYPRSLALFAGQSVCSLRVYAHVRSSLRRSLQSIYVTRECYHNNRRLPCPGSLLIWKALNTVQNQTPFSVVGRSFAAYGGHSLASQTLRRESGVIPIYTLQVFHTQTFQRGDKWLLTKTARCCVNIIPYLEPRSHG